MDYICSRNRNRNRKFSPSMSLYSKGIFGETTLDGLHVYH